MACRGIDLEARPVAEDDDEGLEEIDRSAICLIEAAEALAGMARRRNLCGESELQRPVTEALCSSQDQAKVTERFHDYASTTITIPDKIERIVEKVPSQLCSTSSQLNSMGKSKPKLTEAEKEEQKLRRILANRESARETIRRRKVMHLELVKKAADVLAENETLKKEKELVVENYNSLEDRNKFLKAMLAKAKKPKRGVQEERTKPSSEHPCSAMTNPAIFLHNQAPIAPCFWPSILPSPEGFKFQYAAGSNAISSSHFPVLCSLQGQETPADIDKQGAPAPGPAPLFVLSLPWLLPFVGQSSVLDFNSGPEDARNAHPPLVECNNQLATSNREMNAEASNSGTPGHDGAPGKFTSGRPVESLRPSRNTRMDVSSAPESTFNNSLLKNQEPIANKAKKAENAYAATVARRKRKELMRLKNIHC